MDTPNYSFQTNATPLAQVPSFVDTLKQITEAKEERRKRAIQTAIASGLKADGSIDHQAIRQSLMDSGFGDSSDAVINQLTTARQDNAKIESESRQRDMLQVYNGLMSKDEYNRRHSVSTNIESTLSQPSQPSQSIDTTPEPTKTVGTPKSASETLRDMFKKDDNIKDNNTIVIPGTVSPRSTSMPEPPVSEYKVTKTASQVTPDYLAGSDQDIGNAVDRLPKTQVQETQSSTINVDNLKNDEKTKLSTYLRRSGYNVTDDDSLKQALKSYENTAVKSVPMPTYNPFSEKIGDEMGRYQKASSDYVAQVAKAIQDARKEIRGSYGEIQGQEIASQANKRAETTQKNEIEKITHPAVATVLTTGDDRAKIGSSSSSLKEAQKALINPPKPGSPDWGSWKLSLAKQIQMAKGLTPSKEMLDEIGDNINNGATLQSLLTSDTKSDAFKDLLKTVLNINTIDGARDLVRSTTSQVRSNWMDSYGKGKDFDKYFPEFEPKKQEPKPGTLPEAIKRASVNGKTKSGKPVQTF